MSSEFTVMTFSKATSVANFWNVSEQEWQLPRRMCAAFAIRIKLSNCLPSNRRNRTGGSGEAHRDHGREIARSTRLD